MAPLADGRGSVSALPGSPGSAWRFTTGVSLKVTVRFRGMPTAEAMEEAVEDAAAHARSAMAAGVVGPWPADSANKTVQALVRVHRNEIFPAMFEQLTFDMVAEIEFDIKKRGKKFYVTSSHLGERRDREVDRLMASVKRAFDDKVTVNVHQVKTKVGVSVGRLAVFICFPREVDPRSFSWSPLKFISFPEVTPWEANMDSRTRTTIGVKSCCFKPQCSSSDAQAACTAREFAMRHPLLRRAGRNFGLEAAAERKSERDHKKRMAEVDRANLLSETRRQRTGSSCRWWNIGKCPGKPWFKCSKIHGDPAEAAKVKCYKLKDPNWNHPGGDECPFDHSGEYPEPASEAAGLGPTDPNGDAVMES